jgi:hypothetical protein
MIIHDGKLKEERKKQGTLTPCRPFEDSRSLRLCSLTSTTIGHGLRVDNVFAPKLRRHRTVTSAFLSSLPRHRNHWPPICRCRTPGLLHHHPSTQNGKRNPAHMYKMISKAPQAVHLSAERFLRQSQGASKVAPT